MPANDIADSKEMIEAKLLLEQMWSLYQINAGKMMALHDASVQNMINSLPDEILDMHVGDFLEAAETDPDMAALANLQFEFSDRYNLVTKAEVVVEPDAPVKIYESQEQDESSNEYEDAMEEVPLEKVFAEMGIQTSAVASKQKPQVAEIAIETVPQVSIEPQPVPVIETLDVECQYSMQEIA